MSPDSARLAVNVIGRGPDYLGWPTGAAPPIEAVEATMRANPAEHYWISGAEPTLRPDLPDLIRRLSAIGPIGLDTDGLALGTPAIASVLRDAGLERIRIGLHSSQSDAHDWLVGLSGAAKRARRAIRVCVAAGLEVHAQIVLSRPTTEHLPETIALLFRLGVQGVHLRRPILGPALHTRAIGLSPRLGLLEPWLEGAVEEAASRPLTIYDIPPCVAPRLHRSLFRVEPWLLPEGLNHPVADPAPGCTACPQDATCPGAPGDYLVHFGRTEIDSAGPLPRDAIRRPSHELLPTSPPPPRAGRAPATRLSQLHRQLDLKLLYGDPMNDEEAGTPADIITVPLEGSSRQIRKILVRAAQEGSARLVLVASGPTPHPQLVPLLQDSGRLGFAHITLRAPTSHLESLGAQRKVALRKIHTVEEV